MRLVLTPSFIFAIKSRGFPPPAFAFDEETGTDLGLDAAKSWSRKRYRAARTTPRVRTMTSDEEAMADECADDKAKEEKEKKREGGGKEEESAVVGKSWRSMVRLGRLYRFPGTPKSGRSSHEN